MESRNNKNSNIDLICEPVKQQEWFKQYLEHFKTISPKRRSIDRLSIAEIAQLYNSNKTICDECGKEIDLNHRDVICDHVLRIINPVIWFSCDDCIEKDFKNGWIISHSNERANLINHKTSHHINDRLGNTM